MLKRKSIPNGLIHHWSFCDTIRDAVGNAHLYNGVNYSFISGSNKDQMRIFSAIRLDSGYLQAPPRVYFNGDFTITAWVRINRFSLWGRLIDFDDSVLFTLFNYATSKPVLLCRPCRVESLTLLNYEQWYHIAGTREANLGKIYINGRLDVSGIIKTSITWNLKIFDFLQ